MELHLSPKTIGRGQGRQVVAAAAYRSGERLTDGRTGQTWDFTRRGGVAFSEIIAPSGAVPWSSDRARLWNEAEAAEDKSTRRDTARTAREFEVSLPCQLDAEERRALGLEFARWLVDRYGFVADVSFHDPHKGLDERNFHMHILTTTRVMTDAGFKGKVRELDFGKTASPEILKIRETFASMANGYLERAGIDERIEHLSFADRGLDREATQHLGPDASAMERDGKATRLGDENRAIAERNGEREELAQAAALVAAEIEAETALANDPGVKRVHDATDILDRLTERRSTFTRADLNYLLSKDIPDAKERAVMNDAILSLPDVVGLRDKSSGPIVRYTTREVLTDEREAMKDGAALAGRTAYGLTDRQKAEALDRHARLDHEQREAFDHATGAEGLAIVAGEAGTGKSATLAAIRDAYSDAGRRVIGLSWTNSVVQDMRHDGFTEAATVASALYQLEHGRDAWGSRTVIIVEETAMLATKHLAAIMDHAERAGAKLILAGDDRQLASIERGGLFGALRAEHGAAELHTVRRVAEADQKAAFNHMHRGEFREALALFEQRGAIHWQATTDEARSALVDQYRADLDSAPDKGRFVFAYTNAEVAELNRDLRAVQRERGALGEDHTLATTHGEAAFAPGDRVQLTANGRSRVEKAQGIVNGAVGTVAEIDGQRMVIALDGGKRPVALTIGTDAELGEFGGIRHGYAGTIYKGQGKTLDETYLLHSRHWREGSSYVALSRHRDEARVFVSEDVAGNLDQLARQMSRIEERRAASQFIPEPQREAEAAKAASDGVAALGEADATSIARKEAEAQRKAAMVERIKDPVRQANALARLHAAEEIEGQQDSVTFADEAARIERAEENEAAAAVQAGAQIERDDSLPIAEVLAEEAAEIEAVALPGDLAGLEALSGEVAQIGQATEALAVVDPEQAAVLAAVIEDLQAEIAEIERDAQDIRGRPGAGDYAELRAAHEQAETAAAATEAASNAEPVPLSPTPPEQAADPMVAFIERAEAEKAGLEAERPKDFGYMIERTRGRTR